MRAALNVPERMILSNHRTTFALRLDSSGGTWMRRTLVIFWVLALVLFWVGSAGGVATLALAALMSAPLVVALLRLVRLPAASDD